MVSTADTFVNNVLGSLSLHLPISAFGCLFYTPDSCFDIFLPIFVVESELAHRIKSQIFKIYSLTD